MKKIYFIQTLLVVSIVCTGQSKIIIDEYLIKRTIDNDIFYQWNINGVIFTLESADIAIHPHNKGLDTIYFQKTVNAHTYYDTIFCNIPNNTSLLMTIGCCDDGFDMVKKEDYDQLCKKQSLDSDSAYSLYLNSLDYGWLKFVVKNKPKSDTLIFTYNKPYVNFGQMITTKKDYGWVTPCKFGYIDNIIRIDIFKKTKNMSLTTYADDLDCSKGTDVMVWDIEDESHESIKSFGLRIFDKKNVIIQYDYANGELQLQIDE